MAIKQTYGKVFGSMEAISKGNPDGLPLKGTYMPKKSTTKIGGKTFMPKLKRVKNPSRPGGQKLSRSAVQKSVAKSMGH